MEREVTELDRRTEEYASGPGQYGDRGFDLSNPLRSFMATVRAVLFAPAGFFRRLPPRGSDRNPMIFGLICYVVYLSLTLLAAPFDPLALTSPPPANEALTRVLSELGPAGTVLLVVIIVVLLPLLLVPGLYLQAIAYHLLIGIFVRPTATDFEATLRVFAYSRAIWLLAWVPLLGYLATLYGLYLTFVGIRELHQTTAGRAAAVVVSIAALWLLWLLEMLDITNLL